MKQATEADIAIGRRVKALRIKRGLSQTELSRVMGVTFQQVQKYEKGRNRISAGKLAVVARFLGVRQSDLLGETDATAASGVLSPDALEIALAFDTIPEGQAKAALRQTIQELASRQAEAANAA